MVQLLFLILLPWFYIYPYSRNEERKETKNGSYGWIENEKKGHRDDVISTSNEAAPSVPQSGSVRECSAPMRHT